MQSPYCFIIEPVGNKRYSNTKDFDGHELILSASKEDHTTTNREAVVLAVPLYYNGPIEPGDVVIVHHNVFRLYYDMKGREKSSWSFLRDNTFMVTTEEMFLYRKPNSSWCAIAPYCFVEPIKAKEKDILSSEINEALFGTMIYKNNDQENVQEGDQVVFSPETEYEFKIDGRILYRMRTQNICLVNNKRY
jgi:co-chaperonin GroES (HSP10)